MSDDFDEADQEVIDILDSDHEEQNEAFIQFKKGECRTDKFKKTLDYFLYQKCCSERITTPNLQELEASQSHKRRLVNDWAQAITYQVDNCQVKMSPELIESLISKQQKDPYYIEFEKVVPENHPLRQTLHQLSVSDFRHGIRPLEYKQIDQEWRMNIIRLRASGEYKMLKLERYFNEDFNRFPDWLKPPKKSDFNDEKDFEIAATFLYVLCRNEANAIVK